MLILDFQEQTYGSQKRALEETVILCVCKTELTLPLIAWEAQPPHLDSSIRRLTSSDFWSFGNVRCWMWCCSSSSHLSLVCWRLSTPHLLRTLMIYPMPLPWTHFPPRQISALLLQHLLEPCRNLCFAVCGPDLHVHIVSCPPVETAQSSR